MGSSAQSFYSTPAFELFRRALTTIAVTQFRGMNSFQTQNNVQPNFALDCNNVIVSDTGGLEKMRIPVSLMPPVAGFPSGPAYMQQFQYLAGGTVPTRQVVANYNQSLYALAWNPAGTALAPALIETDPTDSGPWSMIEANNELFMANGIRAAKWLGTGTLKQWGIFAPGGTYANSNTPGNAPSVAAAPGATIAIKATPNGIQINLNVIAITPSVAGGFSFLSPLAPVPGFNSGQTIPFTFAGTNVAALNGQTLNMFIANPGLAANVFPSANNVGIPDVLGGNGTIAPVGPVPLAFGRQWAYAYKNDADGHIGNISAITPSTGPQASGLLYVLTAAAPTDPQVTSIVWYATVDGGGVLFRVPNPQNNGGDWPIATFGLSMAYYFTDTQLDTTSSASFINNPAPLGLYLSKYQGRIIIGPLVGAGQTFAWSGYEQILTGRPEQSFPPNNRINLAIGAESIAGHGAIMPGVVFWSSTGTMWMLRGNLQDIVQSAPVLWSDYLEELPWTMGAYAHNTVQATPAGLVWLAQDKSVNVFNGVSAPQCISEVVNPILRSITPGTEQMAVGTYFNWLERNWYALTICVNGSRTLNKTIFFALEESTQNIDAFPSDIQADFMIVLQTPTGQRILAGSQGGGVVQFPVTSQTTGGVNLNPTSTAGLLPAWWKSGWFGTDYPYRSKMWRQGVLIADNQGFGIHLKYVNYRDETFRQPGRDEIPVLQDEIIEMNRRAHLASIEIIFPDTDIDCAVLELHAGYIGTADRQA